MASYMAMPCKLDKSIQKIQIKNKKIYITYDFLDYIARKKTLNVKLTMTENRTCTTQEWFILMWKSVQHSALRGGITCNGLKIPMMSQ